MVLDNLLQLLDQHMEIGGDVIAVDMVLALVKEQKQHSFTLAELVKVANESEDLEVVLAYESDAPEAKLHLWDRRHLNRMLEIKTSRGKAIEMNSHLLQTKPAISTCAQRQSRG